MLNSIEEFLKIKKKNSNKKNTIEGAYKENFYSNILNVISSYRKLSKLQNLSFKDKSVDQLSEEEIKELIKIYQK